jgi:hypothetical protein
MNDEKPYCHIKKNHSTYRSESTGLISRNSGLGYVHIKSFETGKYSNILIKTLEKHYDFYTKEEFEENFPEYFI